MEAPGGFEPPIRVLQTPALPLGYGAVVACATSILPYHSASGYRTAGNRSIVRVCQLRFGTCADQQPPNATQRAHSFFISRGLVLLSRVRQKEEQPREERRSK
jgi:hypothetical protein